MSYKTVLGIVDYGAGNLRSLANALDELDLVYEWLRAGHDFSGIDKVIVPGVGHAQAAMAALAQRNLLEPLRAWQGPLLGICLGHQLLCRHSAEGDTPLLNLVPADVLRFAPSVGKVPQVGWNSVRLQADCPLLAGLGTEAWFYFVHSYYVPYDPAICVGEAVYGERFTAILHHGQRWGVQFHPEKSGEAGLHLLKNFATLRK